MTKMESLPTFSDQVLLVYAPGDFYAMRAFQELLESQKVRVRRIACGDASPAAKLDRQAVAHEGLLVVLLWSAHWSGRAQTTEIGALLAQRRNTRVHPATLVLSLDDSTVAPEIVPPGYAVIDWAYSYLQSTQRILQELAALGWQAAAEPVDAPTTPHTPGGIHQHIEGSRNIVAGGNIQAGHGSIKS